VRESVTFIHAADLHLGAPFQGLSAEDERVGRELAEATYQAWSRVVDTAIERSVDFVVLAGDLYDAGDPSLRSQIALRFEAQRLDDAGIPLLLVRGNHDPLGGWSANLAMPECVRVFPSGHVERFEVIAEDGFVCGVYGRSYQKSAETSDFTPGYVRDARDTVAVGLLHANVGSNPDYDPYAPCTLAALTSAGMDYWALGHIHKHEVLASDPYVVYAGSAQGLNPKETGAHGCCLVTLSRGGVTAFEHLELAPVTWIAEEIDVSGIENLDRAESLVNERLASARADAGRCAVARVRLTGRAPVHADLARPGVLGQFAEAIRVEQVALEPWVWLDRLENRTAAAIDIAALADSPDFAGELVRISAELGSDSTALESAISEVSAPVIEKLADYVPALSGPELLEAARDRALDLLIIEDGDAS
jgi:DNA repair exonuclease SbcCD nuclease subunit